MILSGGASARMGADKGALDWLGTRAVDRLAQIAGEAGAETVVTVSTTDYGLPQIIEETPRSGPVGGVIAGAAALRAAGYERALVLAADAPTLTAADLAPLLAAGGAGSAYEGLHLPLVLDLNTLTPEAEAGWPMGRFLERSGVRRLPAPAEAALRLRGANDPEERAVLLAELRERETAQDGGAD